jgi:molecular chaperone GrpE (heat shock protein)
MRPDDRSDRIVDEFGPDVPPASRGRRDSGPRAAVPVPVPIATDPSEDLLSAFAQATRGLEVSTPPKPQASVDLLEALKEAATAVADFPPKAAAQGREAAFGADTSRVMSVEASDESTGEVVQAEVEIQAADAVRAGADGPDFFVDQSLSFLHADAQAALRELQRAASQLRDATREASVQAAETVRLRDSELAESVRQTQRELQGTTSMLSSLHSLFGKVRGEGKGQKGGDVSPQEIAALVAGDHVTRLTEGLRHDIQSLADTMRELTSRTGELSARADSLATPAEATAHAAVERVQEELAGIRQAALDALGTLRGTLHAAADDVRRQLAQDIERESADAAKNVRAGIDALHGSVDSLRASSFHVGSALEGMTGSVEDLGVSIGRLQAGVDSALTGLREATSQIDAAVEERKNQADQAARQLATVLNDSAGQAKRLAQAVERAQAQVEVATSELRQVGEFVRDGIVAAGEVSKDGLGELRDLGERELGLLRERLTTAAEALERDLHDARENAAIAIGELREVSVTVLRRLEESTAKAAEAARQKTEDAAQAAAAMNKVVSAQVSQLAERLRHDAEAAGEHARKAQAESDQARAHVQTVSTSLLQQIRQLLDEAQSGVRTQRAEIDESWQQANAALSGARLSLGDAAEDARAAAVAMRNASEDASKVAASAQEAIDKARESTAQFASYASELSQSLAEQAKVAVAKAVAEATEREARARALADAERERVAERDRKMTLELDAARDRERKLNESIAGLRQQLESAQGRERELTRSLARGQERLSASQKELIDARHRLADVEQELTAVRQRGAERHRELSGEFEGMLARERYERALAMLTLLESIDEVATDALTWGNERGRERAVELAARLRDVSATMGLEEIPVREGLLNDDEHEIVAFVGASQRFPEGSIVEVRQRGYRLNGNVLRRAQVVLAGRAKAVAADAPPPHQERARPLTPTGLADLPPRMPLREMRGGLGGGGSQIPPA